MTRPRAFQQVDVFSSTPYLGNPVAVVTDADGLTTEQMQRLANWTNLSETTFVLAPDDAAADYRVRIFTPTFELPFAGHPTLGTCHAWLRSGGAPRDSDVIVQECGVGLVRIRRSGGTSSFAAPPMLRTGPLEDALLGRVVAVLGVDRSDVVATQWVDNGPGWIGVLLRDADAVLAVRPGDLDGLKIGIAGPSEPDRDFAFEVRAFFPQGTLTVEDPVTGSLNASLAQWFERDAIATAPYRVRQGTALGRRGTVLVERAEPGGGLWIGGTTATLVEGTVRL